jgi:hypothetical protein
LGKTFKNLLIFLVKKAQRKSQNPIK